MLAGAPVALPGDEGVQPLDRRALRRIGADVQDLSRASFGEALKAHPADRVQRFPLRRRPRLAEDLRVTCSGCMIISVQSQADLSSVVNVDISGVQNSPSSGMTP